MAITKEDVISFIEKMTVLDLAELVMQEGNTRIGRYRDRPIEAVVRDEHPILLQPLQNRLCLRREAADVEILL